MGISEESHTWQSDENLMALSATLGPFLYFHETFEQIWFGNATSDTFRHFFLVSIFFSLTNWPPKPCQSQPRLGYCIIYASF